MLRHSAWLLIIMLTVGAFHLPPIARAAGNDPDELQLAKGSGPILWQVGDEEKRKTMENDLELLRLYNEAKAAKKKRKSLGLALFTPGMILVGGGFVAGLFQNAIGLYDQETGEYMMVGGVGLGMALIVPGIYFTGWKSSEEKAYDAYMREKYGVVPIMQINPDPDNWRVGLGFRF